MTLDLSGPQQFAKRLGPFAGFTDFYAATAGDWQLITVVSEPSTVCLLLPDLVVLSRWRRSRRPTQA
ncbi:MAG TPA: hypothetical protein VMX57_06990 [Planctomycetota bacterium]|nr:hypothetical protein [Planctomycetota bacterium]